MTLSSANLASDVQVIVENPQGFDDRTDDEEELDYDSTGLDEELGVIEEVPDQELKDKDGSFEAVESVIEFRTERRKQMIDPENLEGYIQKVIDSRWKEKEKELLRQHKEVPDVIRAGPSGQNSNTNSQQNSWLGNKAKKSDMGHGPEIIKSPSDTTLYAPSLNKTPVWEFNFVNPQAEFFNRQTEPLVN